MTIDILLVFIILAATILLFASDRFRLDLIAMLALLALLLTGILTPKEALAGFSSSIVLMIAGLFVVGGGIFQTGVADTMGNWLGKVAGNNLVRLMVVVMLVTALLSAFMSSTGTVAVMLPIVVSLARRNRISPSQLLIPLAFASLLGGMITLIGTPPNIVVSDQLRAQGLEPLGFFAFTPVGLTMLVVGIAFMLLIGRHLLPKRKGVADELDQEVLSLRELSEAYGLDKSLFKIQVPADSQLVGKKLSETKLRRRYQVNAIAVESQGPRGQYSRRAEPDSILRADDILYVKAKPEALEHLLAETQLKLLEQEKVRLPKPVLMAEVLLTPRSSFIGKNLRDIRFRDKYGVTVLAEKRGGEIITSGTSVTPLNVGDTMLVAGGRKALSLLRDESHNFIVATEPEELRERVFNKKRAPWAIAILLGMLTLMTFGITANVTAVILAAVAMVVSRSLSADEAYRSINWESVVLIAAVLPLATALDKTGGMQLIVDSMVANLGGAGPYVIMIALFLLTSAFSQVISNTATTVLVAPIAFQVAVNLGVSPQTLLMTVAIAASTAFATPVASPVNALVLNPGNYKFTDFLKVGVLLHLFIMIATVLVVPLIFPF